MGRSRKGVESQIGVVTKKEVESQKDVESQREVVTQVGVVVQKGAEFEEMAALVASVDMSGKLQCSCMSFPEYGIFFPSDDWPQVCTVMLHRKGISGRLDSKSQVTLVGTPLTFCLTEKMVQVRCAHGVTVNYAVDRIMFEGLGGSECQGGSIPSDVVYALEWGRDFVRFDDICHERGDVPTVGLTHTKTVTAPDGERSEVEVTRKRGMSAQRTDLTSRDKTDADLVDKTAEVVTRLVSNWRDDSISGGDCGSEKEREHRIEGLEKEVSELKGHMVTWHGMNKALREEVDENVKRERVLRQTAEHRVEELEKKVLELRPVHLAKCEQEPQGRDGGTRRSSKKSSAREIG
ncbi:uncharacterized protein [Dendrobates tinctorius]|uniref:uncharacterized protein isoform X1 n=1 Tax=Dendrobates tinctorius TaxID=92724 RepID=UPI003CC99E53